MELIKLSSICVFLYHFYPKRLYLGSNSYRHTFTTLANLNIADKMSQIGLIAEILQFALDGVFHVRI